MRNILLQVLALTAVAVATVCALITDSKPEFACESTPFCKRSRSLAEHAAQHYEWRSPFAVKAGSVRLEGGVLTAEVRQRINRIGNKSMHQLRIEFGKRGSSRLQLIELSRSKPEKINKSGADIRKDRFANAGKHMMAGDIELDTSADFTSQRSAGATVKFGPSSERTLEIRYAPFGVTLFNKGEPLLKINDRQLLNIECWDQFTPDKIAKIEDRRNASGDLPLDSWFDPPTDGMWADTTDSRPLGPESVGVDIVFPSFTHLFGIPEHCDSFLLKDTRALNWNLRGDENEEAVGKDQAKLDWIGRPVHKDPYRIFNTDISRHEIDDPVGTYGAIPFMVATRPNASVGVFWLNAADTFVDIQRVANDEGARNAHTHWFSEAGIIDILMLAEQSPSDILTEYGLIFGMPVLPPIFSLGYHQSRWNYVSTGDVLEVESNLDKYDMPVDVFWLDLEYTDSARYFTWKKDKFPEPDLLLDKLDKNARKLVVLLDPHIKKDEKWSVYRRLIDKKLIVLDKTGNPFVGKCWPGQSVWADFTNPAAVKFWQYLHRPEEFGVLGTNIYDWNDMAEASVFDGQLTTFPKDVVHYDGFENRQLHSLYGMLLLKGSYDGLLERSQYKKRPFILTRSFAAGSQRYAATWTGDNVSTWSMLRREIATILSNGLTGMGFCGADVGAFFDDPGTELLIRWYELGIFYPFFREHSELMTKRREPYLLEEQDRMKIKRLLDIRYELLPTWYTAMHTSHVKNLPPMRSQMQMFPQDVNGYALDEQFFIGDSGLLVKPITEAGKVTSEIYLADDQPHYDYHDFSVHVGRGEVSVEAPLGRVPILIRGGNVIFKREIPRNSAELMANDPFTVVIALDKNESASGTFYYDDGISFDYEKDGMFIHKRIQYANNEIKYGDKRGGLMRLPDAKRTDDAFGHLFIQDIRVLSATDRPEGKNTIRFLDGDDEWESEIEWTREKGSSVGVIKRANLPITGAWSIIF